jgi:hypothetical protein
LARGRAVEGGVFVDVRVLVVLVFGRDGGKDVVVRVFAVERVFAPLLLSLRRQSAVDETLPQLHLRRLLPRQARSEGRKLPLSVSETRPQPFSLPTRTAETGALDGRSGGRVSLAEDVGAASDGGREAIARLAAVGGAAENVAVLVTGEVVVRVVSSKPTTIAGRSGSGRTFSSTVDGALAGSELALQTFKGGGEVVARSVSWRCLSCSRAAVVRSASER